MLHLVVEVVIIQILSLALRGQMDALRALGLRALDVRSIERMLRILELSLGLVAHALVPVTEFLLIGALCKCLFALLILLRELWYNIMSLPFERIDTLPLVLIVLGCFVPFQVWLTRRIWKGLWDIHQRRGEAMFEEAFGA